MKLIVKQKIRQAPDGVVVWAIKVTSQMRVATDDSMTLVARREV